MACPACGGQNRITSGNGFRCTSQRVVDQVPAGMAGNLGPSPIPIFETCGYFYTFVEEQAKLQASWAAQQAAAAAAEAERERRGELRKANWRAWELGRPAMIQAALEHSDPYERLVLCARHWCRGENPHPINPTLVQNFNHTHRRRTGGAYGKPEIAPTPEPAVHPLDGQITQPDPELWGPSFPELWKQAPSTLLSEIPPWRSDAVATWFVASARRAALKPNSGYMADVGMFRRHRFKPMFLVTGARQVRSGR